MIKKKKHDHIIEFNKKKVSRQTCEPGQPGLPRQIHKPSQ